MEALTNNLINIYKDLFTNQFIDGEWRKGKSEKAIKNFNPYNGELLLSIIGASIQDLDDAYLAAEKAQIKWENTPLIEKQIIFERLIQKLTEYKEVIIEWLIVESGSTRLKANIEYMAALGNAKEAASFITKVNGSIRPSINKNKENYIYRKPKGVIGIIGPWNFPFHLTMRSIAPAIAMGNGVVVKPASDTPVTSGLLLGKIFEEAGFPQGLVNVIVGRGSEIGDEFVKHSIPQLISFTGSTEVGRRVGELAGKHIKDVALELGGNNAFLVLKDADVKYASKAAVFGKFNHNGQICMAINRIIVVKEVYEEFKNEFLSLVKQLRTGNPSDDNTHIGPLINSEQISRIQEDVNLSVSLGAQIILDGKAEGCLLEPIILTEVTHDMPIVKNEVFGPVASIIKVDSEQEAIEMANDTIYGLTASVFTNNLYHGMKVAKQIKAGMVHVNDQPANDEAHVPFGGEKSSGIGRFNAEWAIEKFTTVKWIGVQDGFHDYPF
ncbi:aldehyde dehydrogenase family protein [Lysinibacillus capsici]|uniref:aldehyde dehydrogenase family protein n=1 Tax=Lysinibacillus capsici TaxID=2115968 RepID=UPI00369BE4D3